MASAKLAASSFLPATLSVRLPFWTSEANVDSVNNAWLVDTDNNGAISYGAKTNTLRVRLVRGTSTPTLCNNDDARYSALGDGTISDVKTGLMWKQCQEGLSGVACTSGTPLGFSAVATITDRLAAVNASAVLGLGYGDWRIPTRNELASIANRAEGWKVGSGRNVSSMAVPPQNVEGTAVGSVFRAETALDNEY